MTLTIETTVQDTRIIELPVPFFARTKDGSEYRALLDAKTTVTIYDGNSLKFVKNCNPDFDKSELVKAWQTWVSCTETEFLEKYDEVLASISLHPKLAV